MNGGPGLLRSMPVRLALALLALFAVVSVLGLAASYLVTRRAYEDTIRADLTQDIAGFRAADGPFALARQVDREAQVTDPERLVLSYIGPTLRHHGNAMIARDGEGYHIVTLDKSQAPARGRYMALTARLYGGQLTIARNLSEVDRLGAVFVNILALALLPTVLIGLAGGLWLARRGRRQVAVIEATLGRLTGGDLAAQVAVTPGWSEDMARIGHGINAMARAQGQSVAALKQVSTDIAHDLKTPVQRAMLHLDELAQQPLDPGAEALVARAQAELEGISHVFHALLQIARIEAGAPAAAFGPVDLAELARGFTELYEPSAADGGRVLLSDTGSEPVVVQGDRALLGQALANLIENALRHTPEGSTVRVAAGVQDGTARLVVSDNGPGIPEAERENVLQRLYRLDHSRNTPGSGLGLSLVAVIARLHGAGLRLEDNAPGVRAVLSFRTG